MKKKLFSIITAAAVVAGTAVTAAAFDVTTAEEAASDDLLTFYTGRQESAIQTHLNFLLPSGTWRLRSISSGTNLTSSANSAWLVGSPSLLRAPETDLYELSFLGKDKQLELSLAYDTNAWRPAADFDRHGLKGAGQYSFGEYHAATGFSYSSVARYDAEMLEKERQLKSLGLFMEAGKRIANVTTGLMYVYMNGDDTAKGNDFRPFYLFSSMANNAYRDSEAYLDQAQAISVYADYDLGGQFNFRGGLGIAKVDERMKADRLQKEESYRWAVNLDANYKLLDNLVYEAHFGFLDSSDLFDDPSGSDSQQQNFLPDSPVYHLINQLTMTF